MNKKRVHFLGDGVQPYDSEGRAATTRRLWAIPEYRQKVSGAIKGKSKPLSCRISLSKRTKAKLRTMSLSERAYLAGIVDGEGTIGIYSRRIGRSMPALFVKVSNTSIALINWLQFKVGGSISSPQLSRHPNGKPVYVWRSGGVLAFKITRSILPLLVVKDRQARLALEFMKRRWESAEIADSYCAKMKALNKRGIK